MAICGLVITLQRDTVSQAPPIGPTQRDAPGRSRALQQLESWPDLTLGRGEGPRHPAVLESATPQSLADQIEALRDLPGVLQVDLAFADYELTDDDSDDAVQAEQG